MIKLGDTDRFRQLLPEAHLFSLCSIRPFIDLRWPEFWNNTKGKLDLID